MEAEELDREWSAWLEERKRPAPSDPEFTRQVMAAVRASADQRRRKPAGSSAGSRAPAAWPEWIRRLLSPRPAFAFATLALAAVLAIRHLPAGPGANVGDTRIKGEGFRIGYLLKRGARIAPAASGEGFLPGDRLQAIYTADRAGYIRFFSLDAAGRVDCLSCSGPDTLSPPGQEKTFPFALELDADPADEALVGVWTPTPMVAGVSEPWLHEAWLRSSRDFSRLERVLPQSAPAGSRISFFLLRKKVSL